MNKLIVSLVTLVTLASCASFNPPPEFYEAQVARIRAMTILLNQPLATVDCPSGCNVSIRDPRSASLVPAVNEGTTAGKVAMVAMKESAKVLTFGIGAVAAVKVVDKIGDTQYNIDSQGDVSIDNTDIASEENSFGPVTGDTRGDETGDTIDNSDSSTYADSSNNSVDNSDSSDNSNQGNPVDTSDNSDNSDNTDNTDNSNQGNPVSPQVTQ